MRISISANLHSCILKTWIQEAKCPSAFAVILLCSINSSVKVSELYQEEGTNFSKRPEGVGVKFYSYSHFVWSIWSPITNNSIWFAAVKDDLCQKKTTN